MRRAWVFIAIAIVAAGSRDTTALGRPQAGPPDVAPSIVSKSATAGAVPARALVQQYCVTCHSDRLKTGGLSLAGLDPDDTAARAETWEKVVLKLRGRMMPPQGMPRPDDATLEAFTTALEHSLDRQAIGQPNPGHQPVHRLNRTEYGNAVRDLLHLDVDVTELLPPDDESNGFDNIAGVLKVSPSLLEQYIGAARTVSSLAVGNDAGLGQKIYRVTPDTEQSDHIEGLPLGTRGGLLIRHNFPQDADYDFNVFLLRNIVGYMTGLEFAHQIEISIDGERVFISQVGGEDDNLASDTNMSAGGDAIDARLKTRVHVKAGPRLVGVTFVQRNHAESDEPLQPHRRDHDLQNMNGIPKIDYVKIQGPYQATGPGDTPSRRRIFTCRPSRPAEEAACARSILGTLARRAYRRPVTSADLQPLMAMYDAGRTKGSFDAGIEQALRLVLANPKFLFRTETDPGAGSGAVGLQRVSGLVLASRLSLFLRSSIPDDERVTLAAAGQLSQPAVLEQQVKRMLADPRAEAIVQNFAGQWLMLRNLKSHFPNGPDFPNFDDNLRQAFRTETEMFFGSIMREDRSVLDLLNADYTFVNERLARHYGIASVYGSQFRRVTVADPARRGLLGQGSILTITSYPNRTSPVLRGKWILENILGTPPPPPPPNVPALKENDEGGEAQPLRQRMEAHRRDPGCASCHRVMDPLGFALENFDGVGAWRSREAGGPIDAEGQLADGTRVDGPIALRQALMKQPEQFVRTMTSKMLTYALGRGVEYYDMPLVRAIARESARQNYRFSALVFGFVKSTPFQMKKSQEPVNLTATASH
jgi:hypothetical protein